MKLIQLRSVEKLGMIRILGNPPNHGLWNFGGGGWRFLRFKNDKAKKIQPDPSPSLLNSVKYCVILIAACKREKARVIRFFFLLSHLDGFPSSPPAALSTLTFLSCIESACTFGSVHKLSHSMPVCPAPAGGDGVGGGRRDCPNPVEFPSSASPPPS